MDELITVDGWVKFCYSSQCPHCGEWIEHGDDSCEWNKIRKFTCDCCEKEYNVSF